MARSIALVASRGDLGRFRYRELLGRELNDGERKQFRDVLERAYGGWPAPDIGVTTPAVDYLQWKLEGPPGLETFVSLVEDGDRIVSVDSSLHQLAKLGGLQVVTRWGSDSANDPEYQGIGLTRWRWAQRKERWERAAAQREEKARFSFSTTTHPRVFRTQGKEGFEFVPSGLQTLMRVFDLRRMLAAPTIRRRDARVPTAAVAAAYLATRALQTLRHPPHRRRNDFRGVLRRVDRVDERITGFYERAAEPFDFMGLHTADSFNWRYCDPRGGAFTVTLAEEGAELVGVLVRKTTGDRGYVAEMLTVPGRAEVARALLEDALDALRRDGVAAVLCWLPQRHPHQRVLRRYGFVDARRPANLSYQPIGPDSPQEVAMLGERDAAIHLMYGHADAL